MRLSRNLPWPDRILAKSSVDESGCWIWQMKIDRHGYGKITVMGKQCLAHRISYEQFMGSIPDSKPLDHLCRVRCCVNPFHLEPVSDAENALRGNSPNIVAFRENRCRKGHPMTKDNVYVEQKGRRCRRCYLQWKRDFRRNNREALRGR